MPAPRLLRRFSCRVQAILLQVKVRVAGDGVYGPRHHQSSVHQQDPDECYPQFGHRISIPVHKEADREPPAGLFNYLL